VHCTCKLPLRLRVRGLKVLGFTSINSKLTAVTVAIMVMLICVVSAWWLAFSELKVNGPTYSRIVQTKDLVADRAGLGNSDSRISGFSA